jgi:hypothetical protein
MSDTWGEDASPANALLPADQIAEPRDILASISEGAIMAREHFVNQRAYHADSGHEGVILDVRLNIPKQTALFCHDGTQASDANWVNLEKLKLLPPEAPDDDEGVA